MILLDVHFYSRLLIVLYYGMLFSYVEIYILKNGM